MNDDLLAGAVSDWLKTSEVPPVDPRRSRSRAVARARETRQVRSRVPGFTWGLPQPSLTIAVATVATVVLVGLLGFVVLLAGTRPPVNLAPAQAGAPSPSTVAEVRPSAVGMDDGAPEVESTEGSAERVVDPMVESRDALWAEPETAPAPHRGGRAVTIEFAGSTLEGRRWPDGTVRVLEDGAGNATELVDQVVVAPDDTVWVARNRAIFALGREGRYRPPADAAGERWRIIGLDARPDGSLEVLTWRALWHFDDGRWTALPTPPYIAYESDLEGYDPDPMPDGSIWGSRNDETGGLARYTDDGWVDYRLSEIMPRSFPQEPDADVRFDLDGARDGTIWLASMDGPVALAYFDGSTWTEYPQAVVKDVLGHRPERVSDILAAPDGVTWILFGVDGEAHDLVRIEGDRWTSTTIDAIRKKAGVSGSIPLGWLAEAAADGAVQLYTWEDEHRAALWWNGNKARLLEFGVFTPVGETSDGTLWGVGRNKDVGLLARPAD